jgi:putative oxidoreductase
MDEMNIARSLITIERLESTLLLTTNSIFTLPGLDLLDRLYLDFPSGVVGMMLLLLRVGTGALFVLHGYPKMTHLQQWASLLKMPVFLCFLSAFSMLAGGMCLIVGLFTPLASTAIFGSMAVAIYLDIVRGLPLVAADPYLIPPGEYQGQNGTGEPPSWEKASMYCLMLMSIAVLGPGAFSIDALLFG